MAHLMIVNFSRFFWAVNGFSWISLHILFSLIQHNALKHTSSPADFFDVWWRLSPWFGNWIWLTAIIFWLVRRNDALRLPKRARVIIHTGALFLLLPLYWLICVTMRIAIDGDGFHLLPEKLLKVISNSALLDVFIYAAVLALALGIQFYRNAIDRQLELKLVNDQLIKEQLKTLRSQLNPHFIFNTLNTIVSLVRLKREPEAILALTELSQMLRKILENKNTAEASVKDEMVFINSYLAIQKMRFSDRLNTTVVVDESCLDIIIPNMLLHPLVENAIQHGSQLERTVNNFHMSISNKEGMLVVTMTNNVGQNDAAKGFGIGMGNTREILTRLYSHFQLDVKEKCEGVVETILAIPIGGNNA